MKLIAVLIGLAVVVLVIVGYDLLMKLAKNEDKYVKKIQNDAWESYFKDKGGLEEVMKATEAHLHEQEKQRIEAIKRKIYEPNESDSTESKPKTTKTKSK